MRVKVYKRLPSNRSTLTKSVRAAMNEATAYHAVRAYFSARRRRSVRRFEMMKLERERRRREFLRRKERERLMYVMMIAIVTANLANERVVWTKQRSSDWWENVVCSSFSSEQWMENFRMSKSTFLYLCDEIRSTVERQDTILRKAVPTDKRVALTLWFLATGADFRTIAHLFGVSKSTVSVVVRDVSSAILQLLPRYIRFPTGDALKEVVAGFKTEYGFPQCAGAIDGSHIPIVSPTECPADYYNRKGWHSIVLQGAVDNNGRFTDIYVGWPGRVHDARVFANSTLFQRGQTKTLLPDWTEKISDVNVPLVMLGDPAYPLLRWLMKGFPDSGNLTRAEKHFNYRLSKARVIVEHTYGRLKGRWRCLLKRLDVSTASVPGLVGACCVLHNLCEMHGDSFDQEWMEGVNTHESTRMSTNSSTSQSEENAVLIRKAFMTHFAR